MNHISDFLQLFYVQKFAHDWFLYYIDIYSGKAEILIKNGPQTKADFNNSWPLFSFFIINHLYVSMCLPFIAFIITGNYFPCSLFFFMCASLNPPLICSIQQLGKKRGVHWKKSRVRKSLPSTPDGAYSHVFWNGCTGLLHIAKLKSATFCTSKFPMLDLC